MRCRQSYVPHSRLSIKAVKTHVQVSSACRQCMRASEALHCMHFDSWNIRNNNETVSTMPVATLPTPLLASSATYCVSKDRLDTFLCCICSIARDSFLNVSSRKSSVIACYNIDMAVSVLSILRCRLCCLYDSSHAPLEEVGLSSLLCATEQASPCCQQIADVAIASPDRTAIWLKSRC